MSSILSIQKFQRVFIFLFIAILVGCISSRDMEESKAIASRVHLQMQTGDYASIYKESAPRFKSVGSESQFVSMMKKISQESGALKKAEPISYESGVDSSIGSTHVILSDLKYERINYEERMIIVRSNSGQMQLWKLDIEPMD